MTFLAPNWRSLNPLKRSRITIPKRSRSQNHQVGVAMLDVGLHWGCFQIVDLALGISPGSVWVRRSTNIQPVRRNFNYTNRDHLTWLENGWPGLSRCISY